MGPLLHSRRMRGRIFVSILRGKKGQTAVEYLLTMATLVVVFAAMFGFLQKALKASFTSGGTLILATYPRSS